MKLRIIKNRAGIYRVQKQRSDADWENLPLIMRGDKCGPFETKDWDKAVDRMTWEATVERRERDRIAWATIQEFDFDDDGIERIT